LFAMTLIVITGITNLYSQPVRNAVERNSDRNQIAGEQATIQRDKLELEQFRTLNRNLTNAIATKNGDAAATAKEGIVAAMQREIAQGEAKLASAATERNQSVAEVKSENRDVNRTRSQGRPVATARNVAQRNDDVRDRRDDQGDLAEAKLRNTRQKEILAAFSAINVQSNPQAFDNLQSTKSLVQEFEQSMARDMGENAEEKREDQREIREGR